MRFSAILFAIFSSSVYARPASFFRELSVKQTGAIGTSTASLALTNPGMQSSSLLDKRQEGGQVLWKRTLEATYYFDCPRAGKGRRSFQWTANYNPETGYFRLDSGLNVKNMGPIAADGANFAATWVGTLCLPVKGYTCSYVWTGRTDGKVDEKGIAMELKVISRDPADRPKLTELCTPPAGVGEICPAFDLNNMVDCKISGIRIKKIQ